MPDDLADRISDGVVAVLELVPGEKRFVDLSRHVLKGGAERFRPVVLTDEPVRYLVPVGVPGKKLDFGTLLVQRSRVALVWRSDPARPYHAVVCDLNRRTTVSQTAVVVRGETWGRFDMRDESASMTFLVPPVATPGLPRALHAALIEEPDARVARFATAPLAAAITDEEPPADASPETPLIPAEQKRAEDAAPAPDAPTQVIASSDVREQGRAQEQRDADEDWAQGSPAPQGETRPDAPTQVFAGATGAEPESSAERTSVLEPQDAGETRVAPAAERPGAGERPPAPPSARVSTAEAAPAYREVEQRQRPARPSVFGPNAVRGFFIGLLATLAVGAIFLILRLLGG